MVESKDIYFNGNKIPNSKFKLISKNGIVALDDLQLEDKKLFNFNVIWSKKYFSIFTNAKDKKLSDFLKQFNIKRDVGDSEVNFSINLFCNCDPWDIDLKNIKGHAKIDAKNGNFKDIDVGFAKIFTMLNIDSIDNILTLDFEDLTTEGFSYNNMQADIIIEDSVAKIDSFVIESDSSNINISGSSDISKQDYDVLVSVSPETAKAIPLLSYLGGQALLGVSIFLHDNIFFDDELATPFFNNLLNFKYKIKGSWDNPKIEAYDRKSIKKQ